MVQLRADPWRPDHSAGAEVGFDEDLSKAVTDTGVETDDWSAGIRVVPCPPEPFVFVDGVMRTELRVLASEKDTRAWGMLGSYAAGAVRCDRRATFIAEEEPVGRALLMGGRIEAGDLEIDAGNTRLCYSYHPVANDTPQGLRTGLQRLMLGAEGSLAARLSDDAIVLADGPLHLDIPPNARVVGVVKRMVKAYLEGDAAALLPRLRPGERTPLFALGNNVLDRYAFYIRLLEQDPTWHELAGLVRCEVRMGIGLEQARALADLIACHLPSYAGRPGVDPRAPQNLTPVGALEARLKHRLGSARLLTRLLQAHLAEVAA